MKIVRILFWASVAFFMLAAFWPQLCELWTDVYEAFEAFIYALPPSLR